jgi:hypothetical protein
MTDVIHNNRFRSIYERTDYIVNSDMSQPFALARTWRYGVVSEIARRSGFPPVDRSPNLSPLVLRAPSLPKGK